MEEKIKGYDDTHNREDQNSAATSPASLLMGFLFLIFSLLSPTNRFLLDFRFTPIP